MFCTINDPIARLGTLTQGTIDVKTFQDYEGLNATWEEDGRIEECTVKSFAMTWVAKGKDPIEILNYQQNFNEKSADLISKTQSGDVFYFDKVMVKCPGNLEERKVNSLVFRIK